MEAEACDMAKLKRALREYKRETNIGVKSQQDLKGVLNISVVTSEEDFEMTKRKQLLKEENKFGISS